MADRRKMRQALRHGVAQKPAIGHVHLCVPQRLAPQPYSKQMLNQYKLEQYHRVAAGSAVVFALKIFHQFIDARKIHCRVDFSQQMLLRHQHIHTQHLDCLPLFRLAFQHFHYPSPLYQKKAACATFSDRLTGSDHTGSCPGFSIVCLLYTYLLPQQKVL